MNAVREIRFPLSVRRLSGSHAPAAGAEDLVVVCLVRDGATYLQEFLSHYRALGARQIVFLDNGSSDGTPQALVAEPDVTVLQTFAPYKLYKDIMKRFLVKRFGRGNWVLCVDIDELFDYPFREHLNTSKLLRYLNTHRYTAVAAHLLDLFPRGAITEAHGSSWRAEHRFYDISDITKVRYGERHGSANHAPEIEFSIIFGGIRSSKFQIQPMLTKHPLLFPSGGLVYENAHLVRGAKVADFSAVLLHYKYAGDFISYAQKIVEEGSFWQGSNEYKSYLKSFETDNSFSLYTPQARELSSVERLLDEGFLVASEAFRAGAPPPR